MRVSQNLTGCCECAVAAKMHEKCAPACRSKLPEERHRHRSLRNQQRKSHSAGNEMLRGDQAWASRFKPEVVWHRSRVAVVRLYCSAGVGYGSKGRIGSHVLPSLCEVLCAGPRPAICTDISKLVAASSPSHGGRVRGQACNSWRLSKTGCRRV